MTLKYQTLVVCLDDSDHSGARLDFALALAAGLGAHLTGLHLSYMPDAAMAAYDGVEVLYERLERDLTQRQASAREVFEDRARQARVDHAWVAARSGDMAAVTAFARASDLVIAGQPDPADSASYVGEGFPSRFLIELGRPVLFLPRGLAPATTFDNVLVAWNGSREATRAAFDALPLLCAARRVTVLTVTPALPPANAAVPRPDLAALLRRHGVNALQEETLSSEAPGDWLLARVADRGTPADLLVAGAWGHSRLAEFVLGGATRSLLTGMTLPVLLSH